MYLKQDACKAETQNGLVEELQERLPGLERRQVGVWASAKLQYLGGQVEPGSLLPVQYNEILRRRAAVDGERRLMFAVLEDAVECYLKHMNGQSRRRRLLFCEVQNWMNAKHRVGLFSYETLCEALGIDAKTLRAALESRLRRRHSRMLFSVAAADDGMVLAIPAV